MIRKFDETEQYDTAMKIIFATYYAHKLSEVQAVLGPDFELVTPRSVGITEEIPEQQDTIAGNASQKARYVHDRTGCDCLADDTGLAVGALGGAPGEHSARYAPGGHDTPPVDGKLPGRKTTAVINYGIGIKRFHLRKRKKIGQLKQLP